MRKDHEMSQKNGRKQHWRKNKKKRLNVQLKGKATYSNLYRIEKSKCSYVCGSDNLPVSADERCS